jgi:hypothetical protein
MLIIKELFSKHLILKSVLESTSQKPSLQQGLRFLLIILLSPPQILMLIASFYCFCSHLHLAIPLGPERLDYPLLLCVSFSGQQQVSWLAIKVKRQSRDCLEGLGP